MAYRLVYVSSAVRLFSDEQLKELLEVSRRNNTVNGITGMLLYLEGNFIQVLEGEQKDVKTTHLRIARDPRHAGMVVLLQGEIETRDFAEWSMGFHKIEAGAVEDLPGYSDFLDQKADLDQQASFALRLLEHFKKINR